MKSHALVCISAGMLQPKKADNPIAKLHLYLNYGLLGLASILADAGFSPIVIHGRFELPGDFVHRLFSKGLLPSAHPILLSVPSSFALPWARCVSRTIRATDPEAHIIVGGRWVVADDEPWIRAQLPDVDQFVPGLAENVIETLVARRSSSSSHRLLRKSIRRETAIPRLNYELLDQWHDFQPSLEVSRGCGMHCSFCAEAEEALGEMKSPRVLAEEFVRLAGTYGSEDVTPYLEASFFRPTTSWCGGFLDAIREADVSLKWRAETRVDAISPQQLELLARSGLRVLDMGLESASPRQLHAMKKTMRPNAYLHRASELLRACDAANVWAKVNVLLHPGETLASIDETIAWLEAHRRFIKGLSVGPTILFRYGRATDSVLQSFNALGASEVRPGALNELGFAHLDLSPEVSHDAAMTISRDISRSFMSERDYFDLKSFSYLPRSVSWSDFQSIVAASKDVEYSFRLD
jgi:hypothetical protein